MANFLAPPPMLSNQIIAVISEKTCWQYKSVLWTDVLILKLASSSNAAFNPDARLPLGPCSVHPGLKEFWGGGQQEGQAILHLDHLLNHHHPHLLHLLRDGGGGGDSLSGQKEEVHQAGQSGGWQPGGVFS